MNGTLWGAFTSIIGLGLLVAAFIRPKRSVIDWLTILMDLGFIAGLVLAVLGGIEQLAEGSERFFGLPSEAVWAGFTLAFLRGLVVLKTRHEDARSLRTDSPKAP